MHWISKSRTNSSIKDLNFISGALNLLDHCTHPSDFEDLAKPNNFLNGTNFLYEPLQCYFESWYFRWREWSCKWRLKVTPYLQFMLDLPVERLLIYEPAFSYLGVDYIGPIACK